MRKILYLSAVPEKLAKLFRGYFFGAPGTLGTVGLHATTPDKKLFNEL